MSAARIARSSRIRLFIALLTIFLMLILTIIYRGTEQELEDLQAKMMRCEQEQESINEQLRTVMEQKFKMKQNQEHEVNEYLESKRNFELKLKEQNDAHTKDATEARIRYEKLQQSHKMFQMECSMSKKQQLEAANEMEKRVESLQTALQNTKVQDHEIAMWKEKYDAVVHEKERLEVLLKAADVAAQQQSHVTQLEHLLGEYRANCKYKPKSFPVDILQQQQINKPLNPPETTRNVSPSGMPSFDKPRNEKSFNEQERVSPGLYRIGVKYGATNQTMLSSSTNVKNNASMSLQKRKSNHRASTPLNTSSENLLIKKHGDGLSNTKSILKNIKSFLPFAAQNNRSLILNSVENFQIVPKPLKKLSEEAETQLKQQPEDTGAADAGSKTIHKVAPLSAPRKPTSTESAKIGKRQQPMLEADAHLKQITNASSTSSSRNPQPPLPLPPNQPQRKLPENVAPIPAFDELLKNEAAADAAAASNQKKDDKGITQSVNNAGAADINAAVEELIADNNHEDNDGTNNRYANVVSDLEAKHKQDMPKNNEKNSNKDNNENNNNEDSGAHEIKDHDFVNDQNFNLPGGDDDNFFDAAMDKHVANNKANGARVLVPEHENKDELDNEDEDMLGGGADIAVKQPLGPEQNHHLLDADNLNNEVAGDQGKEFPDGLRLEDAMEEDEDEDEYANLAARQQGAQAIRN